MSKNLRSATGNVVHAAGQHDVRTFGNQPSCTPTGQTGSSSFCRYYETNAPVVTCKKCIKIQKAAEVTAPVEVVAVEVEATTETTPVAADTFNAVTVGQSFQMMGQTYTRIEFPSHLLHLESLSAEDTAKGFLSYWCELSDSSNTLVVSMGSLEVERI